MLADCVLFKKKWYKPIVTIAVVGLILVVFFRDFLVYKLMKDYGNLYSGYKFSVGTDLKLITRYFGIIFVGVLAVSSVVMAVKKKETRTLFMWVQMIVMPVYVPFNSDTRTTTFAFIHSVTYNAYTYINKTYNKRMGFGRNIAFGVGTFGECIYSTHTTA